MIKDKNIQYLSVATLSGFWKMRGDTLLPTLYFSWPAACSAGYSQLLLEMSIYLGSLIALEEEAFLQEM